MKKALIITFYFPPCGSSSTARNIGFGKYLKDFDIEPIILTVREDTFQNNPLFRIDNSYNEALQGLKVIRTRTLIPKWLIRLLFRFRLSRLIKFIFPIEVHLFWLIPAILKAIRILKDEKIDIIITTSLPNTPHFCGYILKILSKKPWIADFQDPMSFRLSDVWGTKIAHMVISFLEKMICKKADGISIQSETAQGILLGKYPFIKREKSIVTTNAYDNDIPVPINPKREPGKFIIVHSGEFYSLLGTSRSNGLNIKKIINRPIEMLEYVHAKADLYPHSAEKLFKVISKLKKESPDIAKDINLILNGYINTADLELIKNLDIESVITMTGLTSYSESLIIIRSADLLYLPLFFDISNKNNYCIPGKLFPYISSLKPVLAPIQDGDSKDILDKSGLGIFLKPFDDDAMVKEIKHLYEMRFQLHNIIKPNLGFIKMFSRRETVHRMANFCNELLQK